MVMVMVILAEIQGNVVPTEVMLVIGVASLVMKPYSRMG
jgi:hypothetical protein